MIFAFLTVLLGGNFYVFWRLWHLLPPNIAGRVILIAAAVILTMSFVLFFTVSEKLPLGLSSALYRIGSSWLIILLYLVIILLVLDTIRWTRLAPMTGMVSGSWLGLGALTVGVAAIFIAGNLVYHNKKRVEVHVALSKPLAVPGGSLKAVFISDLHLGYGIGPRELERWVETINAENPDLILIGGDIVDNSLRPLARLGMGEVLSRFRSTYGTFTVPGNHEYISGIDESIDFFNHTNVTFLRDSVVDVGGLFYVAGRDDKSNASRKSLPELLQGCNTSLPVILLDHQPYDLDLTEVSVADIQLSGHTHRGQVWPISWITDAMFEDSHGYLRKGDTHFLVSSGLGIWGGKFRIGTRSEYAVLNITSVI